MRLPLCLAASLGLVLGFTYTPLLRCTHPSLACDAMVPTAMEDGVVDRIDVVFPKLKVGYVHGNENDYQLQQGRAIDSLRRDYPLLLREEPDLSIFRDDIELADASGKRLSGLTQYSRVFAALRFLRSTAMSTDEVTYRLIVRDDTIRVRWTAKLWMRGLAGLGASELVQLDGVSIYELDQAAYIRRHRLDNIVLSGGGEVQVATPLQFAWPRAGLAMPEAALPFFESVDAALGSGEAMHTMAGSARAAERPAPRGGHPQANADGAEGGAARESPMERAARERREMAAEAARLKELRTPKTEKKGPFSFGLPSFGPQSCESNYDCERPLVCCDLVVARVCCSSGMMIGMPQPSLQEIPIPIPVERDDGPYPPYPTPPDSWGY